MGAAAEVAPAGDRAWSCEELDLFAELRGAVIEAHGFVRRGDWLARLHAAQGADAEDDDLLLSWDTERERMIGILRDAAQALRTADRAAGREALAALRRGVAK